MSGLVRVVQPLQHLLLGGGRLAGLAAVHARCNCEIHPAPALGALEPVDDGLDAVVAHGGLPARSQHALLRGGELVVLVIAAPFDARTAVVVLAQQLLKIEVFDALVPPLGGLSVGGHTAASVMMPPRLAVTSKVVESPPTKRRRTLGGAEGIRTMSIMAFSRASM